MLQFVKYLLLSPKIIIGFQTARRLWYIKPIMPNMPIQPIKPIQPIQPLVFPLLCEQLKNTPFFS